ncbi:hypothetical protein EC973_008030 [Apophysomyces ossiformis]|uniref:RING-type domain-containing protein n=1 Tax=Apophysomyces ossiformis TaxID=679940 RepID=A0A8H7BTX8_9FUNG|nr:hypothetical protein EC973_008030 [Apophysomyces ossiformis]
MNSDLISLSEAAEHIETFYARLADLSQSLEEISNSSSEDHDSADTNTLPEEDGDSDSDWITEEESDGDTYDDDSESNWVTDQEDDSEETEDEEENEEEYEQGITDGETSLTIESDDEDDARSSSAAYRSRLFDDPDDERFATAVYRLRRRRHESYILMQSTFVRRLHDNLHRLSLLLDQTHERRAWFVDAFGTQGTHTTPASSAAVDRLDKRFLQEGDPAEREECTICQETFGVMSELIRMPCKHEYHGPCIRKWLGVSNTCPICRSAMPSEEDQAAEGGDTDDESQFESTDESGVHASEPGLDAREDVMQQCPFGHTIGTIYVYGSSSRFRRGSSEQVQPNPMDEVD